MILYSQTKKHSPIWERCHEVTEKGLTLLLFWLFATTLYAQKEYKPLKNYIKNGGNLATAMTTVNTLSKDDDFMDEPELYYLAALCQRKANDVENMKVYLKQPYDTISFFNTTYGMFEYILKCNEKDELPDKKGKVSITYRNKGYNMLKKYYPNLYSAGIFFTRKKDYTNACKFWSMYLDAVKSPVFEKDKALKNDDRMPRAAFWYMNCAYELKKYEDVFRYTDIAKNDTANTDLYLQYRAISYAKLNDSLNYEKELITGMKAEPNDMFFFSNLTDYYNKTKQYDKALHMIDSVLQINPEKYIMRFAKATVLYNMNHYDACIAIGKDVLQHDSTNTDVYFYIGSCYYQKGIAIDDNLKPNINAKDYNESKNKVNELFRLSLPYIEKYKELKPDAKDRWAPMLYRMYLTLNEAKKFAEIDTLLAKEKEEKKK